MVDRVQVLALVPARGGSKSIPGKNLRDFAGHPLLAYSIVAGLQASQVDRVVVSTDDADIAEAAARYGAEIPFLRPAALAADDSLDWPVFEHALSELARIDGWKPQIVVQLRPTSPLRPPGLVDQAIGLLTADERADSVRGVVPSGQNPYKMWRMADDGHLKPLLDDGPPEAYNQPRQSLPSTYWQTGHIDAVRAATILDQRSMTGDRILGLEIDPRYTVDIDNELDWARAEELAMSGTLSFLDPSGQRRPLPSPIEAIIFDFDGVFTDNRVWVDGDGGETVAAHRGDGWGVAKMKAAGIRLVVLSTETNPVVAARCRKLDLPVEQGLGDKTTALRDWLARQGVPAESAIYIGNDENDIDCFPLVGCALVPVDAHPMARRRADRILSHEGGRGAVRELCDLVLGQAQKGRA